MNNNYRVHKALAKIIWPDAVMSSEGEFGNFEDTERCIVNYKTFDMLEVDEVSGEPTEQAIKSAQAVVKGAGLMIPGVERRLTFKMVFDLAEEALRRGYFNDL